MRVHSNKEVGAGVVLAETAEASNFDVAWKGTDWLPACVNLLRLYAANSSARTGLFQDGNYVIEKHAALWALTTGN